MENTRNFLQTINDAEIAGLLESEEYSLDNSTGFSIVFKKSDVSLTNKTFTTVSLDSFTISSHGYKTGLKVRFTTSGSLPTGLSTLTDYYLIRVSDNTLMVASSQANALSGDYLSISGGSGTHTVSVQTASTPYLKIYSSVDLENWVEMNDCTVEITDSFQILQRDGCYFHKMKVNLVVDSGQYNVHCKIMIKSFK